jgi:hypothetical protein
VTATAEALHAGLCMPADGRRRRSAAIAAAAACEPRQWLAEQLAALRWPEERARSGGDTPDLSGNATIVRGKALRFTMTLLI